MSQQENKQIKSNLFPDIKTETMNSMKEVPVAIPSVIMDFFRRIEEGIHQQTQSIYALRDELDAQSKLLSRNNDRIKKMDASVIALNENIKTNTRSIIYLQDLLLQKQHDTTKKKEISPVALSKGSYLVNTSSRANTYEWPFYFAITYYFENESNDANKDVICGQRLTTNKEAETFFELCRKHQNQVRLTECRIVAHEHYQTLCEIKDVSLGISDLFLLWKQCQQHSWTIDFLTTFGYQQQAIGAECRPQELLHTAILKIANGFIGLSAEEAKTAWLNRCMTSVSSREIILNAISNAGWNQIFAQEIEEWNITKRDGTTITLFFWRT